VRASWAGRVDSELDLCVGIVGIVCVVSHRCGVIRPGFSFDILPDRAINELTDWPAPISPGSKAPE
jgi:hypothetical protein